MTGFYTGKQLTVVPEESQAHCTQDDNLQLSQKRDVLGLQERILLSLQQKKCLNGLQKVIEGLLKANKQTRQSNWIKGLLSQIECIQ